MSDTTITRETLRRDPYALSNIMEFDHVVFSDGHGTIREPVDMHAPEVYDNSSEDGKEDIQVSGDGWTLERGWTGQYMYHGPAMHQSEFIGGNLAFHILETRGYWVATTIYGYPNEWVIAYREAE